MMNPIWISVVVETVQKMSKNCTHCGRRATYPQKKAGQYHTCKHCGHRFKEKESPEKK